MKTSFITLALAALALVASPALAQPVTNKPADGSKPADFIPGVPSPIAPAGSGADAMPVLTGGANSTHTGGSKGGHSVGAGSVSKDDAKVDKPAGKPASGGASSSVPTPKPTSDATTHGAAAIATVTVSAIVAGML
ncbi:hypothetical protein ATCC90586_003662 [Pythium insidiosum]|nr:hypothetical protein ATCC90586_003662 [Pythium insidiosum]